MSYGCYCSECLVYDATYGCETYTLLDETLAIEDIIIDFTNHTQFYVAVRRATGRALLISFGLKPTKNMRARAFSYGLC